MNFICQSNRSIDRSIDWTGDCFERVLFVFCFIFCWPFDSSCLLCVYARVDFYSENFRLNMLARATFFALFLPNTKIKFVEILCAHTNQVVMAFIIIVLIVFVFVIFHCFPVLVWFVYMVYVAVSSTLYLFSSFFSIFIFFPLFFALPV